MLPLIEKELNKWIVEKTVAGGCLSGKDIKCKALTLSEANYTNSAIKQNFQPSDRWFANFLYRYRKIFFKFCSCLFIKEKS